EAPVSRAASTLEVASGPPSREGEAPPELLLQAWSARPARPAEASRETETRLRRRSMELSFLAIPARDRKAMERPGYVSSGGSVTRGRRISSGAARSRCGRNVTPLRDARRQAEVRPAPV